MRVPPEVGRVVDELEARQPQQHHHPVAVVGGGRRRPGALAHVLMNMPAPDAATLGLLGIAPDDDVVEEEGVGDWRGRRARERDRAHDHGHGHDRVGGKRAREVADKPSVAAPAELQAVREAMTGAQRADAEDFGALVPGSDAGVESVRTRVREALAECAHIGGTPLPAWIPPEEKPGDPILMGLVAGDGHLLAARAALRRKRNVVDVYHSLLHARLPVYIVTPMMAVGLSVAAPSHDVVTPNIIITTDTPPADIAYILVRGENGGGHGFDMLVYRGSDDPVRPLSFAYVKRPKPRPVVVEGDTM